MIQERLRALALLVNARLDVEDARRGVSRKYRLDATKRLGFENEHLYPKLTDGNVHITWGAQEEREGTVWIQRGSAWVGYPHYLSDPYQMMEALHVFEREWMARNA